MWLLGNRVNFDRQNTEIDFFKEELQKRFIGLWEEVAKRYGDSDQAVAFELLNEIADINAAESWNRLIARTIDVIRKYSQKSKIIISRNPE